MTTTGSSTLRERIAALQQRGTSPQPTSPPRSQTPTSGPAYAGGTALRDKIARFEQKGGTPIPRGSFGLGAPPQATGKRNNELWGNRIPSTGRSTGASTSPPDRTLSLSVESPGRQRRVSMADAQLGGVKRVDESIVFDSPRGSDMIQSLDIARHTPTPPTFSPRSPTTPAGNSSSLLDLNGASTPEPVIMSRSIPSPSPPGSPPPIIITEEKDGRDSLASSSRDNSSQMDTNADVSPIPQAAVDREATVTSPMLTPSVISNSISTNPDHPRPLTPVEEDISQELSVPIITSGDNPSAPELPESLEGFLQPSLDPKDDMSVSDAPPPHCSLHQSTAEPPPDRLVPTGNMRDSAPHAEEPKTSLVIEQLPLLSETVPPTQSPLDDRVEAWQPTAVDIAAKEPVGHRRQDIPQTQRRGASEPHANSMFHLLDEKPLHIEQPMPATLSTNVSKIPSALQTSNAPEFAHPPTVISRSDTSLSISSSVSQASIDDSPPRVTPILDAFPAVPRYLPSSALPARARTVSSRPNRMSASSTSSTKSTPSLSFSSNSSSTSSPTAAEVAAPLRPPDSRRVTSGLQRSKSQTTRPISSVPAWYDDDSDDGEAGWANVIVTTRPY